MRRDRACSCTPNELAAERASRPRDDIVSALLDAEVDGDRLTELEFNLFFLLLAVAGNETTRNAISGGMLALIEHPDQRAAAARRPVADRPARSRRCCAGSRR